ILLLQTLAQRCAGRCRRFLRFQPANCWKSVIESFAGWVPSPSVKPRLLLLALDVMFGTWGRLAGVGWLSAVAVISAASASAAEPEFRFACDTFVFKTAPVIKYEEGMVFSPPN